MSKPSIFFTIFTLVMVPILASLLFTVNENRSTISTLKKRLSKLESRTTTGSGSSDVQQKLDDLSSQIFTLKKELKSHDLSARVDDITRQLDGQGKLLHETALELQALIKDRTEL